MNAREIKKYLEDSNNNEIIAQSSGQSTIGYFPNGVKYQIDHSYKDEKGTYIITVFDHKKPHFKIGNKTFIVS